MPSCGGAVSISGYRPKFARWPPRAVHDPCVHTDCRESPEEYGDSVRPYRKAGEQQRRLRRIDRQESIALRIGHQGRLEPILRGRVIQLVTPAGEGQVAKRVEVDEVGARHEPAVRLVAERRKRLSGSN